MFGVARKFAEHVLPGVLKPLRVLWNEIFAFAFFVMAAMPLPSIYKSYRDFNGELDVLGRMVLGITFTLVMGGYGLHSLLRARKINKS